MMAVSSGDLKPLENYIQITDSESQCGSAVRKAEDSLPSARNLVVVKETKSGDGERYGQSYPECFLMRESLW
jgi:hypothetical protein